jgi:hypothetical protein
MNDFYYSQYVLYCILIDIAKKSSKHWNEKNFVCVREGKISLKKNAISKHELWGTGGK